MLPSRHGFALFLLLAGCHPRISFGPTGEVKTARELLRLTAAAEAQVVAVKGEAKVKVASPQSNGSAALFVAVSHPALIHLEALDFFGKPKAVLISDGQRFGLYQAEEGAYYRGPASAQNVSRLLPITLPPAELTALLLGRAPRIASDGTLGVDEKARAYKVVLQQGEVTQTLWVDPENHRVIRSELRGVNAYDVAFEDIQEVGAVTYPRRVVLTASAASTQVTLDYKDIVLNEAPDLTMFEQDPPANVPVIDVDERGTPVR